MGGNGKRETGKDGERKGTGGMLKVQGRNYVLFCEGENGVVFNSSCVSYVFAVRRWHPLAPPHCHGLGCYAIAPVAIP